MEPNHWVSLGTELQVPEVQGNQATLRNARALLGSFLCPVTSLLVRPCYARNIGTMLWEVAALGATQSQQSPWFVGCTCLGEQDTAHGPIGSIGTKTFQIKCCKIYPRLQMPSAIIEVVLG